MLNEIEKALKELDNNVYYGISTHNEKCEWNYIVFNRKKIKPSGKNLLGFTDYYSITIVRENYIPEGFEREVIEKIEKDTMLKIADNEYMYNYLIKPNTNTVVELLTMDFVKAKRRVEN